MPEIQVPGHGRAMTAMERAVSHSMTASLTMPTFQVMMKAKPDALIKASKKKGISLTVTIAKACAIAIKKHPTMNWCYQPVDKLVERDNIDIGMAVAAEGIYLGMENFIKHNMVMTRIEIEQIVMHDGSLPFRGYNMRQLWSPGS